MKKYALLPLLSFVLMSAQIDYRKIDITSEDKLFTAQYLYTFESMPPVDVFQVKNNKTQEIRNIEIVWEQNGTVLQEITFSTGNHFLIAGYGFHHWKRPIKIIDYNIYDLESGNPILKNVSTCQISDNGHFIAVTHSENSYNVDSESPYNVDLFLFKNGHMKKIKTFKGMSAYCFITIDDNTYFFWMESKMYNYTSYTPAASELIDLSQFE